MLSRIYVAIGRIPLNENLKEVEDMLLAGVGGYTKWWAYGGWLHPIEGVVKEDVVVYEIEHSVEESGVVETFAKELKELYKQEAVMVVRAFNTKSHMV